MIPFPSCRPETSFPNGRRRGPDDAYLFLRRDGPAAPLWIRSEAPGTIEIAAAALAEVEVVVPFTGQRLGVLAASHEAGRLRCTVPGHLHQAWLRVRPGYSAESGRAK
jgi:hypothetical protein